MNDEETTPAEAPNPTSVGDTVNKVRRAADTAKGAAQMIGGMAKGSISTPGSSGSGGGNFRPMLRDREAAGSRPSANPAEKDAQQKMKSGQGKGGPEGAMGKALETANNAQQVARAAAGDARAAAQLAQRFASHPIETTKSFGRSLKIVAGIALAQVALIGAAALLIVFAFYKVAVMFKGVTDLVTNPSRIATQLSVNMRTAAYLAKNVPKLVYEEQENRAAQKGIVYAAPLNKDVLANNSLSDLELNPETLKMFTAWQSANLERTFFEKYQAEVIPNGSGEAQINSFDPKAWDLYVQNRRIGDLSSDEAQAFIGVFTKQEMHWDDIYTRVGMRRVAQERFDSKEGKLQFEDVGLDMSKSRINVTKKIVGDTMVPIVKNSDVYYRCIIQGGSYCDKLGLGSVGSPTNVSNSTSSSPLVNFVLQARSIALQRLINEVDTQALSRYASKQADDIKDEVDDPDKRTSLVGKISTGASDTILESVPKEKDGSGNTTAYPDRVALLEMYDRFKNATDNGNLGRMMYDRYGNQSVKQGMNYFVGGGQVLNWDMDITNAWSLTDNLSVVEESPIYRRAFMNGSMAVFADGNEEFTKSCQTTFNDQKPVDDGTDYRKRPKNNNVCFSKTLVPVTSEFRNEQNLIEIYQQIEAKNNGFNISGIGQVLQQLSNLLAQAIQGQIRTSPLATEKLSIETRLSPDYDGYNNQIYGTQLTGGETSGEAFEAMWAAAESLDSSTLIDETYGIGAQYLTNQQVSQALQYSNRIDRIAMKYRSFGDRMFALDTPNSVFGRIAMLAPTNTKDGSTKLANLISPSSIASSLATRFVPSAIAQQSADSHMVNPMNAVKMGYSINDPSNTMGSKELWDTYDCKSGGPTQQKQTISTDAPFNVPVSTNPCKRESVLAIVTTCWFSTKDDCSLDGKGSGAFDTTGSIAANATNTAVNGVVSESQTVVTQGCGGIRVHTSIASQVENLCAAAANDGLNLTGGGWRSSDQQIALREQHGCGGANVYNRACKGSPPTAVPGRSNHEKGLAIDFRNCSSRSTACFKWLAANAARFGLFNLPSEPWHWSVDGR